MISQTLVNKLSHRPIGSKKLFINGEWKKGSGKAIDVVSPIDGSFLTTLSSATEADVDKAIGSARKAFLDGRWRTLSPLQRKKILLRLADLIEQNAAELAVLGVRDNGTELSMALRAEPGSAAATFRYYAEAIDKIYGEIAPTEHKALGLVHKEPVGVVGVIIPWNFPLMIAAWKLAPAIASGNSVVLKPAEDASLSILKLAELAIEAGLPAGVLNVITGTGDKTGRALALSMEVDVLAFTGSGETGRRLLEYSAQSNLKRVYLELGGKSPNIVFADTNNLDEAAKVSAFGVFRNSGQVCIAGSRLLIEKNIYSDFVDRVKKYTEKLKVGDPLDLSTDIGAVSSMDQLEKNLKFVERAISEGGELITGGKRLMEETGGYYMQPTIIDGISRHHDLAQEEIFGPVLAIFSFEDEEEAIELANSTSFGLAAGVWTSNLTRAHRMIREIKAGVVHVNTYGGTDISVPIGGMKQSGNGYDKSMHAIEKYVNLKTAWIKF